MLWIPGHIGIIDHEMADKGANFVITLYQGHY